MILHKLTLNNFGLFRGTQTLLLTPNGTGPIVLIGGTNGSGKTTLLEAIRLCLYGKHTLGSRVSIKEYQEYLSSMVHRNPSAALPVNHASISLEFEYVRGGDKKQYRVERAWKQHGKNPNSIKEDLFIYQDNIITPEIESSHWQDYINELIPMSVSQFFFLDGENIQKLVDDSSHDMFLTESIRALLGLNFVERLHSDLRVYANRLIKSESPTPVQDEFTGLESEISELKKTQADNENQLQYLETKIEEINEQIAQQESRITAEGGRFAEKRESLNVKQGQLLADIEALESDIRDLCEELFPFSLVPELLKKLRERLEKEIELDEWETKNNALKSQNATLRETLSSEKFWEDVSLSDDEFEVIQSKLKAKIKLRLNRPKHLQGFNKIRDRSPSEYQRLLEWIEISLNEIPEEFIAVSNTLKEAQLELQKVEEELHRIPTDEVLKPLIEKLSTFNQRLGKLRNEAKNVEESIHSIKSQIQIAEGKLEKLYESLHLCQAHIQRQERVQKVREVLSTYSSELTEAKISTLSEAIVESFNLLSHKPNRIRRVNINPHTFGVTLHDTYNQSLAIDELSAGEKQIYTTALLWGLAKTSGKPLPMILDTPLGRLDNSHRELLVEYYFPYVSHQIILLSTDTEINEHLSSLLEPNISHKLHLEFHNADEYTTIGKGYFR